MKPLPTWLTRWAERRFGGEWEAILGDLIELSVERAPRWPRGWIVMQMIRLVGSEVRDPGPSVNARGGTMTKNGWSGWGLDLRLAVRSARRSPLVSLTIAGTLALAIGANAAVFSVVDAVVLRALPIPEPETVAAVFSRDLDAGVRDQVSPLDLADFREASAFEELAGWTPERYALTGSGLPTQILAMRFTDGLFAILGTQPLFGRIPSPADPADAATVVLTHGFWAERFAADPSVVGRSITLDDAPYEVVGVMPDGFRFPDDDRVAVWMPLVRFPWEEARWTRHTDVIGRLAAGASLEQAHAELASIASALAESEPRTNEGWGVEVVHVDALRSTGTSLPLLLAVVGVVLLIACLNVANLMLSRTTARSAEWSIRGALGAGRGRLVRQLLVEASVYAVSGVAAGLALAHLGLEALLALDPDALPRWYPVGLDLRVVAFTVAVGCATTLLVGLWPAARASRGAAQSSRLARVAGNREAGRLRRTLSTVQVAFAVLLAASAGLLVSSLVRLQDEAPGYRIDGLLAATIDLPGSRYEYGSGRIEQAFDDIRSEVASLPGVVEAGWVTALPLDPGGTDYDIEFFVQDRPAPAAGEPPPTADFRVASEGYLEAMGISVLEGRTLLASDRPGAEPVALVNRALAEAYFGESGALDQSIRLYEASGEPYRVVGVVSDVRHRGLDDQGRPEIYVPYRWMAHDAMTLVVQTAGAPATVGGAVRDAVHRVDPDLPLIDMSTMQARVDATLGSRRFGTSVLLSFAVLGLVLALVGVNGTLSYAVQRRRREIGVRLALGESRGRIRGRVLRSGVVVIGLGSILGLLALIPVTRLYRSLLYGVGPTDPWTLVSVTLGVAVVGLLACLLPAVRASRLDPVVALRQE